MPRRGLLTGLLALSLVGGVEGADAVLLSDELLAYWTLDEAGGT